MTSPHTSDDDKSSEQDCYPVRASKKLEFFIDPEAPEKDHEGWSKLVAVLEYASQRNPLLTKCLSFCKISSNKNLPLSRKCEGGFGGDDNQKNKQLRFGLTHVGNVGRCDEKKKIIVMRPLDSGDGSQKWSQDELLDLANAIAIGFHRYLRKEVSVYKRLAFYPY